MKPLNLCRMGRSSRKKGAKQSYTVTPPNHGQRNDQGLQSQQFTAMRAELYTGELPHPDHLERFEAMCPGATDRWLTRVESQGEHRQRMENKWMNFTGTSQLLGSIFGGLAVLGGIGVGAFLIYQDKNIVGLTAFLTPLALVGGIFYREKGSQRREMARKNQVARR